MPSPPACLSGLGCERVNHVLQTAPAPNRPELTEMCKKYQSVHWSDRPDMQGARPREAVDHSTVYKQLLILFYNFPEPAPRHRGLHQAGAPTGSERSACLLLAMVPGPATLLNARQYHLHGEQCALVRHGSHWHAPPFLPRKEENAGRLETS